MGTVLLGQQIATRISDAVKQDIEGIRTTYGVTPALTIITAEPPTAAKRSEVLVHEVSALKLGIDVHKRILPADATQDDYIRAVEEASADPAVHGLLVLLPLPPHIDQETVFASIDPNKELEGVLEDEAVDDELDDDSPDAKQSSTITALKLLLEEIEYDAWRSRNVFLTEEEIRDNPLVARLLVLASNAGVQIAVVTAGDPQARAITRNADLVVVSVSSPEVLDDTYLKSGAVVVDFLPVMVGEKYSESKGRVVPILKPGVNIEAALRKASYVTPAVGGLGPIAIATMMKNLAINCRRILQSDL